MKRWKVSESIFLLGVLVLATGLRLFRLAKRDFWYDEAFTANLIRHDWSGMMKEITYDVHPPLHYVFLKAYAGVFGDGVFALRLFSVIVGVLSVWMVYLIGKEWFGKRAGLYASLTTAVAPFALHYSQEVRMYALYGFFLLLATWCFLRALKSERYRWWIGWGVSLALAALTHYMTFVFVVCFYVAWVVARIDLMAMRRGSSVRVRLHFFLAFLPSKGFALGAVTAGLLFFPWLSSFLQQLETSQDVSNWKTPARFVDVFRNIQIFVFGTPMGERSLWAFDPNVIKGISSETLSLLLVFGFALFVATLFRRERRKVAVMFVFFVGPLLLAYALSFVDKYYFISRYVLPASFFLYVLVGEWLRRLSYLRAGAALCIYFVALLLIQWPPNSEGYNLLLRRLPEYQAFHFYSLNTFDYVLAKYYVGPERLTLYNVGWPAYDSRSWPGVGYETKRTERFEEVKDDPQGIVIWNTLFPLEQRDDRNFDHRDFERIAVYKNIELYRPKKFVHP